MNEPFCKFRTGVECGLYGERCKTCGWNPVVEADRIKEIMDGGQPYLKINLNYFRRYSDQIRRENEQS